MNHAITIGGLLLAVGALSGLAMAALGLLKWFAGGMSDAPAKGDATSKSGCALFISGALLCIACVAGMVL